MSQKRPARKASSGKSTKSRAAKASAKKKSTPGTKTKAASKKKPAAKTKAASKKRPTVKTKAASKKKAATKTKAASKKKPAAKTKAASKKKAAAKTKAASKKKAAAKTKAASKKKAAAKTKTASKKKAAAKTKAASKKKAATKTKAASKKKAAAKTKAASKTKAAARKKPTAAVSAPTPKPAEVGSAPEVGSADQENSNVTPKTASSRVIRRRPAPASGDTPAPDSTSAPRSGVIRVAAGERTPNRGKRRTGKPVVELNPKLESSRHTLPKAQGQVPGGRPQSFAERVRAEAEAAFQRIAPKWKTEDAPPPAEEAPASSNPALHRSSFEIRISEQDALTTKLRATVGRTALEAAQELARRFRLPPDQGLLLKVIELRDTELTRLALEELLELDDRGRVRSNPELIGTLKGIKSRDKEIKELRGLILEKLGAK